MNEEERRAGTPLSEPPTTRRRRCLLAPDSFSIPADQQVQETVPDPDVDMIPPTQQYEDEETVFIDRMVEELCGSDIRRDAKARVKSCATKLRKNMIVLDKTHARLDKLKRNQELLKDGKWPSATQAHKLPFQCASWELIKSRRENWIVEISEDMNLREAREHISKQCMLMTNSIDLQLAEAQFQETEQKVHLKCFIEEVNFKKEDCMDIKGLNMTEEEKKMFPKEHQGAKFRLEMAKNAWKEVMQRAMNMSARNKEKLQNKEERKQRIIESLSLRSPAEHLEEFIKNKIQETVKKKRVPHLVDLGKMTVSALNTGSQVDASHFENPEQEQINMWGLRTGAYASPGARKKAKGAQKGTEGKSKGKGKGKGTPKPNQPKGKGRGKGGNKQQSQSRAQ